jgi:RNA polymerase sigma-70 factor, ECF subfamily
LDVESRDLVTILEACRQNDRLNQTRLFHLLKDFAMRVCYRYHSSDEEVSDIISESFFKLFKNLDSFDLTRWKDPDSGLKAWFKRILINTCVDHLRKNGTDKKLLTNLPGSKNIVEKSENGADRLGYKEIIECIQSLSPAYRMIFNLYVIEGMKHEEIAGLLGISVGASKSNLSKARDRLKTIIQERNKCKPINLAS